jgi:beta-lactamase family protein
VAGSRVLRFGVVVALALTLLAGWHLVREPDFNRIQVGTLEDFERELETLRTRLRIPGMSAAIAANARVIWARGFGMADLERGILTREDTIYHLASLTKPYASTLKIPELRVTFVILANSDGLSRWRSLGDEADVSASPAATLFLNWYSRRGAF